MKSYQEHAGTDYLRQEPLTVTEALSREIKYTRKTRKGMLWDDPVIWLEKAVKRRDLVSVNHRLAGLLASYFDILFAFNRALHPGEKRLAHKAAALCERLPQDFQVDLQDVLHQSGLADQQFLVRLRDLLDHLDQWLVLDGFPVGSKDGSD